MLHNGPGGAVHHLIVLGVLQQDPHDGGGGDIGEQPIRHRLIAGGVHQVPAEARTVVVIGGDKPLALELFVQVDRRPGRQISSLGVSADAQGTPGAGRATAPAYSAAFTWAGTAERKLMLKSSCQPTMVMSVPR